MLGRINTHRRVAAVVGAVAMLGVTVLAWPGQASHQPADKLAVAGSTVERAAPGEQVVLLRQDLRTSSPTDLIIQASLECSLVTDVKTVGNDDSRAAGTVKIWVEIDDVVVPVSTGDTEEPGKVVACHRAYQRTTSLFDDEDATIETFFDTKSTHGFNWIALNLGNGIHRVELVADLSTEATPDNATAEAVVGKRTLVGTPVKLVNDATVDEGDTGAAE